MGSWLYLMYGYLQLQWTNASKKPGICHNKLLICSNLETIHTRFFRISTTLYQRILYHVFLSYQLSLSVIVISVKCILGERSWLRALRSRYKYVLCQSKFSFFFSERFQFQVFRKRTSLLMVLINQPRVGRLTRLFLNSRYVIGPVFKNSNANI